MSYTITIPAAQSGLPDDHTYYVELSQVVILADEKTLHILFTKVDVNTYRFGRQSYPFEETAYNYLMSLSSDTTVGSTISNAIWNHFINNDMLAEFLLGRPLADGESLPAMTPA